MDRHDDYRFSITVHTDDEALAVTLRALAWYCQTSGNKQIAVSGTKLPDWKRDGHKITFHFDNPTYRENFLGQAKRMFRLEWENAGERNDDPAPRQS